MLAVPHRRVFSEPNATTTANDHRSNTTTTTILSCHHILTWANGLWFSRRTKLAMRERNRAWDAVTDNIKLVVAVSCGGGFFRFDGEDGGLVEVADNEIDDVELDVGHETLESRKE